MDLGDILVMPFTGERHRTWDAYRSSFSKTSENATPGYYTVTLDQAKVKAELTATTHAALHRYTYEQVELCFYPDRLAARTGMERKTISFAGKQLRGKLGKRQHAYRTCQQQSMG